MHNDYLNPDIHNPSHEDYGFDDLVKALKARDNGRWSWDEIHASWTGKDADLEPHGHQGVTLENICDEFAYATAHTGKTFVGHDVCLNVPRWVDNQASCKVLDKVREIYMEQAQEIVCGCNVHGEWDGDSWYMSDSVSFKVPVILDDNGEPKFGEIADSLIAEGEKALKQIEDELVLADEIMSQIAGWLTIRKNGKRHHHKEGRPCRGSAWSMYLWEKNKK
jgi:hypothetical protein